MKYLMLAALVFVTQVHQLQGRDAIPAAGEFMEPIILPKGDLLSLLEILASLEGRPIVVPDERILDLPMPLMLAAPVSYDAARKAIASVLFLEGYEVVEAGGDLKLKRILTEEQCALLNKGLGRTRGTLPEKPVIRMRSNPDGSTSPYVMDPKKIIVRPDAKN